MDCREIPPIGEIFSGVQLDPLRRCDIIQKENTALE
jgi:hypothetical protein